LKSLLNVALLTPVAFEQPGLSRTGRPRRPRPFGWNIDANRADVSLGSTTPFGADGGFGFGIFWAPRLLLSTIDSTD
jgi:hypothetical protein